MSGCANPKLLMKYSTTVCKHESSSIYYFGGNGTNGRREHVLRDNRTDAEFQLMFHTSARNLSNNRKYLRRLCVKKLDASKKYYYRDITESTQTSFASYFPFMRTNRNSQLFIEILEDRPVGPNDALQTVPFSQVNTSNRLAPNVLQKINLNRLDDDGVNLPINLNQKFYIKIYAQGSANKKRLIEMNCVFYIDYAGDIENVSESVRGPQLRPGTDKVLFGNRS